MPEVQKNPYLNSTFHPAAGTEGAQVAPGWVAQVGAVYPDYYPAANMSSTASYSGARPFDLNITGFSQTLNICTGSYRYGFNGKEQDPETYGTGNIYDYGFRIYNPRIAKFLSVDPLFKEYAFLSTYQFAANCPISGIDLDGLEFFYASDGSLLGKYGTSDEVFLVNNEYIETARNILSALNNPEYFTKHGSVALRLLDDNSCNTGLTNSELNVRAFLSTIQTIEGHGKALGYNQLYGGGTFEGDQHPNKKITKWGYTSTAAGAYQFLYKTWMRFKEKPKLKDFSPQSQDVAAIAQIKEKNALSDIESGNIPNAFDKLKGTWPSLPGGSQQYAKIDVAQDIFKGNIANELNGQSNIAMPTQREIDYQEKNNSNESSEENN